MTRCLAALVALTLSACTLEAGDGFATIESAHVSAQLEGSLPERVAPAGLLLAVGHGAGMFENLTVTSDGTVTADLGHPSDHLDAHVDFEEEAHE